MNEMKIWTRFETSDEAFKSAKRLTIKYGQHFAIIFDNMGIEGFSYPYTVISHVNVGR